MGERVIQERERQLVQKEHDKLEKEKLRKKEKEKKKAKAAKQIQALSFNMDDEGDEGEDLEDEDSPPKKKRFGMNPEVDTKFLPDRDRDEEEKQLREQLRKQWEHKQKLIKEEEVEIV